MTLKFEVNALVLNKTLQKFEDLFKIKNYIKVDEDEVVLVGSENKMTITGHHLEGSLHKSCEYTGDNFNAIISFDKLYFLTSCQNSNIHFILNGTECKILADNSEYILVLPERREFNFSPKPSEKVELGINMYQGFLRKLIQSYDFVEKIGMRSIKDVLLDIQNHFISIIATNGSELYIEKFAISDEIEIQVLISPNLLPLLEDIENARLNIYTSYISFIHPDYILNIESALNKEFEDYTKFFSPDIPPLFSFIFEKAEIELVFKRFRMLNYEKNSSIEITYCDDYFCISCTNNLIESTTYYLAGKVEGDPDVVKIRLNNLDLLIKSIDSQSICFNIFGKKKVLTISGNDQLRYVTPRL